MKLPILYQDDRYVAVNKPAGMLVHRSPMDREDSVFCLQLLRNQLGRRVYPCHRLDKPTSGVLLFALDKEAHQAVSRLFVDKGVRKTYHALVRGWLEGEGTVDHPLRRVTDSGHQSSVDSRQAAVTHWKCLECFEVGEPIGRFQTARYSLVALVPKTGRTHQLRRHMKHLDHHIIGDTRYGDGLHNRFFRERFSVQRLLLQGLEMEFRHPYDEHLLSVSAPLDSDFAGLLSILEHGRV